MQYTCVSWHGSLSSASVVAAFTPFGRWQTGPIAGIGARLRQSYRDIDLEDAHER